MKKTIALIVSFLFVFIISCRHEALIDPPPGVTPPPPGAPLICFETNVLPIFVSNCAKSGCHDANTRADGIRLDNYTSIMKGIKPNLPNDSKYWKVIITTDNDDRMPPPPAAPLSKAQKDSIYKWIVQGAQNTTNCASAGCDLTQFSYNAIVKPILQNNCNGCHGATAPSAGLNLTDYNVVKTIALNGRLMGSVKQIAPYSPMPPGGKLSACQIEQLDKWVQAGAPNN
jgi:mono/diheme cytochrome c family protein